MSSTSVLAPRMIGRQGQFAELAQHLQAARHGAGRVVLLAGEAGVGKTRLLHEFLAHARRTSGIELLVGRCYDEQPALPYGPFIDVMRMDLRERGASALAEDAGLWLGDLARLLPELAALAPGTNSSDEPQAQKRRMFEAIGRVLEPNDSRTCRIIVLEDIHWSDQTSQELIRYLARALGSARVLLLATYRSDELHRRHPLTSLLAYLTRERLYAEIRLDPLERDELAEMVEESLGYAVPARFVDELYSRSEGNPFFVEEILKSLLENDQLDALIARANEGKTIDHLAIPASIKDSVLSRTAGLEPDTSEVLRYAAVVGRRFDFDLLLRLTGLDEDVLLDAIGQLVTSQIVVEERGDEEDRYRFRHALIREAIYDDMLGRERRIKHREVLHALEARGADQSAVDQLAHHAYQARELPQAARYARQAAERAWDMYAYREAVSRYHLALELIDDDDDQRADLLSQLGQAAYALGDTAIALRAWREARPLYADMGNQVEAGDMDRRLARVLWERGDTQAAFAALASALATLEPLPPSYSLGMAYSSYSQLHMVLNHNEQAIEWGQKALKLAADLGDEVIEAHALNNIGCSLAALGTPDQGVAHLRRSLELSKKHHMLLDTVRAYLNLGGTLSGMGAIEEALSELAAGIDFADHYGLMGYKSTILSKLAQIELEIGAWDKAEEHAIQSIATDTHLNCTYGSMLLAELRVRQGRFDEARDGLEYAIDDIHDNYQLQMSLCVLMRVYAAKGDTAKALDYLKRWQEIWEEHIPHNKLRASAAEAVQVALDADQPELANLLLVQLAAPIERDCDYAWLAPLLPHDALGMFAAHAGRHTQAAEHFVQAAQLWQERELPFYEGRSRRHAAASLLQTGVLADRETALRELAQAQGIFATLGAAYELAQTEALIRRSSQRPRRTSRADGLTPREQQVIALIARGASNRSIAEQLTISEKTVEVHVSNILGKLGFSSRTQAATYAVEQQLDGVR